MFFQRTNTHPEGTAEYRRTPPLQLEDLAIGERYAVRLRRPAHSPECCLCEDVDRQVVADLIEVAHGAAVFELPVSDFDDYAHFRPGSHRAKHSREKRLEIPEADLAELVVGAEHEVREFTAAAQLDQLDRDLADLKSCLVQVQPESAFRMTLDYIDNEEADGTLALYERPAVSEEGKVFGWPSLGRQFTVRGRGYRLGASVIPVEGPFAGRRCFVNDTKLLRPAENRDLRARQNRAKGNYDRYEENGRLLAIAGLEQYGLDDVLPRDSVRVESNDGILLAALDHIRGDASTTHPPRLDVEFDLEPKELGAFALAVLDNPDCVETLIRESTIEALS